MQNNLAIPTPSLRYSWYVVGLLTLANISSFLDRQILALLVVPIKRDLHLSDTKISLLMGLSFALFYTVFGIILSRLADSSNRRNVIIALHQPRGLRQGEHEALGHFRPLLDELAGSDECNRHQAGHQVAGKHGSVPGCDCLVGVG